MGELGIYPVTTTKLLGIDRRTNARQARRTRTKRLGILWHRLAKLKVYKRAGATVTMVAKSCLKPALMYGCKCLGLDDAALQRLRVALTACVPGNEDFKSTTTRLAIDSADPTGEITAAPIVAWSSALRRHHGSAHPDSSAEDADDSHASGFVTKSPRSSNGMRHDVAPH